MKLSTKPLAVLFAIMTPFLLTACEFGAGSSTSGGTSDPGTADSAESTFRDCEDCPEMVMIPAGVFFMGSGESEFNSYDNEGPRHSVSVEAFAIGKYEVTVDEWKACVAAKGCQSHGGNWRRGHPMTVRWEAAQEYVAWLSRMTGETYRLPSEAEWEYTARAFPGLKGPYAPAYAFGDTITDDQANFGSKYLALTLPNSPATTEVGHYPPNAWGLHDMHGNVSEWVEDCWHENYNGAPSDGRAWVDDNECGRVVRGGSWRNNSRDLRSAYRHWAVAGLKTVRLRSVEIGFRVARKLNP